MAKSRPRYLAPRRRTFQWSITLLLVLVPFIRLDDRSMLRIDLESLSFIAFGQIFRLEDLELALGFSLLLVLFFLLATLVLGRVWCGWACPQTALSDLGEGFAGMIGLDPSRTGRGHLGRRLLLHLFYLLVALLAGCTLVWYFIAPHDFFQHLGRGDIGTGAALTLAVTAATVYLDMAFVRRLFCREFCPYGRFQAALIDPGTLTLRFHPDEADRCIRCGACERACPMGIDIRSGDQQIECINCGRCLDACRAVMAELRQPGIIRYTFGLTGRGARELFNPRLALIACALLTVTAALTYALLNRPVATLNLRHSPTAQSRLLNERQQVTFFVAYLTNHRQNELEARMCVSTPADERLEIRGPAGSKIVLPPGGRQRLEVAVLSAPVTPGAALPVTLSLVGGNGASLAGASAIIVAPSSNNGASQ